jgi:predicted DNA-binding WGR domain protein
MKFIKRSKLAFTEGNSDKVYEVDLCEQSNHSEYRFLVNFRYGRRGTQLKEGTKTPVAVDAQKAEDIFNSLVVSKLNKGYVDVNAAKPTPRPTPSRASFDLNEFLTQIEREKDSRQRARMIWRLPQTANADLAARLAAELNKGEWPEIYAKLWVIGRTGDRRQAEAVKALLNNHDAKIAALSAEVLVKLDVEAAMPLLSQARSALPTELISAIDANDEAEIARLLDVRLNDKKNDNNGLLKSLYLQATLSPALHRALMQIVQALAVEPGVFKGLRYLFKMAEFRLDAPMYATLSHRFETTKPFFISNYWYWNYSRRSEPTRLQKELAKDNCGIAYSDKTRLYLRRRAWRALKRLGVRDDDRYADMAAQILLAYSENDKKPEKTVQRYDWQDGGRQTVEYDAYAGFLIFNEILRSNSNQFKRSLNRQSWLKVAETADAYRTEAFPQLWDRRPELLLDLLIHGRVDPVAEFAAKALADNRSFCDAISDDHIYQLLISPLNAAVEFAAELLQHRQISHTLLALLLKSGNEKACGIAFDALAKIDDIFSLPELLLQLLLIENQPLNEWLSQRWSSHLFDYGDAKLLDDTLETLSGADGLITTEEQAGWLAGLFIKYMESAVRDLSVDKILPLFTRAGDAIRLFAAYLLNANRVAFRDIPSSIVELINRSDSAAVRALGVALLNKTAEYELANQVPLLVELIYHGEPAERSACFALLEKLLPAYGTVIFAQLLPLAFKEERQFGQQDELFEFIQNHLLQERNALDKDTVWRLVHASSAAAQRIGVDIIDQYDMRAFSVKQWVVLANNPNLTVRRRIQQTFEHYVDIVKQNSGSGLRLLESSWPDSREFGYHFFNRYYQASDWSVELIVSVCDSNLPETQTYGRELLQTFFEQSQGESYLLKLSQHPSAQVQAFVSQLLNDYAAGKPDIIVALKPYFVSVLSQINRGRVSKDRVLAFLIQEANASQSVLAMVAELFTRLSLTLVHKDKSQLIKAMLALKKQHPDLKLPLHSQPVRLLTAAQGENHAS